MIPPSQADGSAVERLRVSDRLRGPGRSIRGWGFQPQQPSTTCPAGAGSPSHGMSSRRQCRQLGTWFTRVVAWAFLSAVISLAAEAGVDYETEIAPLLARRCGECHGADKQESGLRLDDRSNLLRGGDYGERTVVPGDSKTSFLIQVVSGGSPDLRMPPEGDLLTKQEIQLLRAWIDQGAQMPEGASAADSEHRHWSFQPVNPVTPPVVDDPWVANPIDAFILTRLRNEGLSPSPPASTRTLTRRVHLVMHGLPPTSDALEEWVSLESSTSPQKLLRRLVDDVLRSPHYGERWAQHWLDVIRWAETVGFETNAARPNAWPYRDWVIDALNADKPFDRFVFEQIAGDTVGQDAALGFLVAGPANLPGQIGRDEQAMREARQDELDEVIRTVGQAFLGLTIGCARCHSHKFDPITQRDYYAIQAIFSGLKYGDRRLRGLENDRQTARLPQVRRELASLKSELDELRRSLRLREPLQDVQEERFDAVEASAVRMEIAATGDGRQASLYEFEVWSQGSGDIESVNVALADRGANASASGFALENQTRHPDNLIDGTVDARQAYPWKADKPGPAWIQIDLADRATIDRIVWQRGAGRPADYVITVKRPDDSWHIVATTGDRLPRLDDTRPAEEITLDGATEQDVAGLVKLIGHVRSKQAEVSRLSAGPRVYAASFAEPQETWVLRRGDAMQRGDRIAPNVPAAFDDLGLTTDAAELDRRVALAKFVAGPDNPLTARVIVNRIWQHHFGTGLVETPSDFGRMGSPPSHPELLDWLARELIDNNWSLKHIHRLILTSSTFRQSSAPREAALAVDTDSRLLWRFPPRRLDAEALRDSILQTSGKLNRAMHGPGFDFFNQKGGLSDYKPKETFEKDGWRRMIYATKIRMQAVDVFGAFDCPDAGQMTPRRTRSITPIQALSLLNSPFLNRQAGFLAERARAEAGADVGDQVDRAVEAALGRSPSDDERLRLVALATEHGLEQVCRVLFNTNEFVFIP